MPIRKRENGSWLVDVRSGGLRVRKTLSRKLDYQQVAQIEQTLMGSLAERPRAREERRALPTSAEWRRVYDRARERAKRAGLPFDLTWEQFGWLIERSRGLCEMTGIPFSWVRSDAWYRRPFVPSLDRLRAADGYTILNARLVCAAANVALNEWGEDVFRDMATGYVNMLAERSGYRAVIGSMGTNGHRPGDVQPVPQ